MTRAEYERHKQRLDEELRAGMEMLAAAHRHQIRALEMVWAAMGEEGAAIPPSVGAPVALEPMAPPPATPPQKPRRHKSGELFEAVRTALGQLPETFNRNDVCAALGYNPDRSSLFRVFQELQAEGALAMKRRGDGNVPTVYKKTGT